MRLPASTYRLQLNADVPFSRVHELIDYFDRLGVGDLYFSPIFQARANSHHGYDVTDPRRFNREVGDEDAFADLSAALRARDIGVILDVVPNHMAASVDNPWWRAVLEHGRSSPAAQLFDIDWDAPGCHGRIVLPVLARELEEELAAGAIGLSERAGKPVITYGDLAFPISPDTYGEGLPAVLEKQAYRLHWWRSGMRCVNYRRFFDVSDLVGVRVESPDVFATTHALLLDLVHSDQIDGVRIDHVDGLRDPAAYLTQLRASIGDRYVVVEKILAPNEDLREDWPVEGTTGYDFIGLLAGLYCEPTGLARLTESYAARTGQLPFSEIAYQNKKLVVDQLFASELTALATDLLGMAESLDVHAELDTLKECITEVSAALHVYRTYIREQIDGYDRCVVKLAVNAARHRAPHIPDQIYGLIRAVLLGEELSVDDLPLRAVFISNWQQFTGPVIAKGVEDSAFYTYNRLLALNEVGAAPDAAVASASELHEIFAKRAHHWPATMNASSTHDTKRSEDVRARIQVLTEIPDAWEAALDRWTSRAAFPGINEQILVYQTLLGVWPLDEAEERTLPQRLGRFLQKAAREAKIESSWLEPNPDYEQKLMDFTESLLSDADFLNDFKPFQERIAWYGALNSLSQLVLKLGAPGIPDIYQGNESWLFQLVDPDNRTAVDFAALEAKLDRFPEEISFADVAGWLRDWKDGRIKLHLTRAGLRLRRASHALFTHGEYIPIGARGRYANNVIAFARRHDDEWALIVAGRFYSQLGPEPLGTAWGDTSLELPADAPRAWHNAFTNEITNGSSLEAVFKTLPFGLLIA